MNHGKLVFAQITQHVPLTTFRRCVARYAGEHKVKSFSCLDQYLSSVAPARPCRWKSGDQMRIVDALGREGVGHGPPLRELADGARGRAGIGRNRASVYRPRGSGRRRLSLLGEHVTTDIGSSTTSGSIDLTFATWT
jgi:hypothetical protein